MATVWRILTRDLARLGKAPKVWVILIGVMITPALYAWFNVVAFWDPYGRTANIDIAVVNQDRGAESDLTGDIDVGRQLVGQLSTNSQLGWKFMDEDAADHALKKGDVFATVIVPPDFSADFLTMFQGTYTRPTLVYRVNEKINAISPKITDQGAATLDTRISSEFKEKVAAAVTTELSKAGGDLADRIGKAGGDTAGTFADTARTMSSARDEVGRIRQSISDAGPTIDATKKALQDVDATLEDAGNALNQVQSIMTDVQEQVASFSEAATGAYVEGTSALADGTATADSAVASVTGELERAGSVLDSTNRSVTGVVDQGDRVVAELQKIVDSAAVAPGVAQPLNDVLADLRDRAASNRDLLDDLSGVQSGTSDTVTSVREASDALTRATAQSRDAARGLSGSVTEALPALNRAIGKVNATAGSFAGALASQRGLLEQSSGLLDGVKKQLSASDEVLAAFQDDLTGIGDGLETARLDVLALTAATDNGILGAVSGLDSVGISRFTASPAQLDSHPVYPVATYGSGMASLFTNLSLWIGAFMLMVIFRTEVDTSGLRRVSVRQAYLGRLLLLAVLSMFQGLVVGVGDLVIGVQSVNPVAFVLTCVLTGLAYLCIIYGLISAFGHIGRGIAVVLAFIQIPGASGMYPIEMTPDFFRAIYPFLPFTYGIDALRETVGGFYGNHYWKAMGALAVMALVSSAVGILLRRHLSHVNLLVNSQLARGGLVVNEKVQIVGSSYRLSDMIHALRDRDDFRDEIDHRWRRLRHRYPALLKGAVIGGVLGVIVLGVLTRILPDQKALLFGLLCLWLLLSVGSVAVLEYMRQSFSRAQELADLPTTQLRDAVTTESTPSGDGDRA